MALGGVPTGSMNAHEAATVSGITNRLGARFISPATAKKMGLLAKKMGLLAKLRRPR